MAVTQDDKSIVPVSNEPAVPKAEESPLLTYAKANPIMTIMVVGIILFLMYYFFTKKDGNDTNIKIDSVLQD